MANIDQRRQTLQRIVAFLVSFQGDFLENGVRQLRPLTRAMVAAELGVHESTVSRATASKYVMLPSGKVIPLSDFFTPSLSAKDVIKDIIEHETEPLTDEQIAERLGEMGIVVAGWTAARRRTGSARRGRCRTATRWIWGSRTSRTWRRYASACWPAGRWRRT